MSFYNNSNEYEDGLTLDAWRLYNSLWPPEAPEAIYGPSKLANGLYLGSWEDATNRERLRALKIDAIVNCAHELSQHATRVVDRSTGSTQLLDRVPNYTLNRGTTYLGLPISDIPTFPIHIYFDQAAEFIRQQRERGRSVLIHCRAGVSRSATIAAVYFMRMGNMTPRAALRHIKECRQIICPNIGFIQQLLLWGDGH